MVPAGRRPRAFGKGDVVGSPSQRSSASGLAISTILSNLCIALAQCALYALEFPEVAASAASFSASPNAFMGCSSALLLSS